MININWSTLLFQILNFVVMVLILARFFFKPVIKAMDERSKRITAALDEAARREQEAEAMHAEYEQKLAEANEMVIQMKQQAQEELERTRQQFIAQAQREIEQMRNKAHEEIRDAHRQAIQQHRLELGQLVATLTARLIQEAGGASFQEATMREFVNRLDSLPAQTYRDRMSGENEPVSVQFTTAAPIDEDMLAQVKTRVETLINHPVNMQHKVNPALVAGATLRIGDTMIDGSLEGQLQTLRAQYMHELEQSVK